MYFLHTYHKNIIIFTNFCVSNGGSICNTSAIVDTQIFENYILCVQKYNINLYLREA